MVVVLMNTLALSPSQRARSVPAAGGPQPADCLSMLEWKRQNGILGHQRVFSLSPCKGRGNKSKGFLNSPTLLTSPDSFLNVVGFQGLKPSTAKPNLGSGGKSSSSADMKSASPAKADAGATNAGSLSARGSSSSSASSAADSDAEDLPKKGDGGGGSSSSTSPNKTGKNNKKKEQANKPSGPLDAIRRHFTEKLGWVENNDPTSPFCDFRYSLSRRDLGLRPSVLASNKIPFDMCINFFACCGGLTTKSGLLRNLERYIPSMGERLRCGIAPSFDLADMRSTITFVDAFQRQQCRALLYQHCKAKGNSFIPESTLRLAWNTATSAKPPALSKEQWRQLTVASAGQPLSGGNAVFRNEREGVELAESIKNFGYTGLDAGENIWILKPSNANRGRGIRVVRDLTEILKFARCPPLGILGNTNPVLAAHALTAEALSTQQTLKTTKNQRSNSPGKRPSVPSADDLVGDRYMIQKYIERPMIINNRKFDIRQWVVVTSFSPTLRAWFYQDAYLRFASRPYSTSSIDDKFAHLTNNAIQKHNPDSGFKLDDTMWHSDKFAKYLHDNNFRATYSNLEQVSGSGYGTSSTSGAHGGGGLTSSASSGSSSSSSSSGQHQHHTTTRSRKLTWADVQRQMKKLVWSSLQASKERVVGRAGSFEVFGYDFMVDCNGQVWILECNSSPDLSFSTATTREMVGKMMPDMLNVVIGEERLGTADGARNNKKCGRFIRLEPDYSKMSASTSPRAQRSASFSGQSPYSATYGAPLPFSPPPFSRGHHAQTPLLTINANMYAPGTRGGTANYSSGLSTSAAAAAWSSSAGGAHQNYTAQSAVSSANPKKKRSNYMLTNSMTLSQFVSTPGGSGSGGGTAGGSSSSHIAGNHSHLFSSTGGFMVSSPSSLAGAAQSSLPGASTGAGSGADNLPLRDRMLSTLLPIGSSESPDRKPRAKNRARPTLPPARSRSLILDTSNGGSGRDINIGDDAHAAPPLTTMKLKVAAVTSGVDAGTTAAGIGNRRGARPQSNDLVTARAAAGGGPPDIGKEKSTSKRKISSPDRKPEKRDGAAKALGPRQTLNGSTSKPKAVVVATGSSEKSSTTGGASVFV